MFIHFLNQGIYLKSSSVFISTSVLWVSGWTMQIHGSRYALEGTEILRWRRIENC